MAQALEHNLYIHQAGLLDEIKTQYEVPDDVDIICGFALGYQGEADILPEPYNERELQEEFETQLKIS